MAVAMLKKRNRRISVRTIQSQGQKPRKTRPAANVASFLVICAIAFMFWYATWNGATP